MISWVADILAWQKSSPQKADTKAQIRQSISHPVMIMRTQIVCLLAMIACMPVFAFTETINGITWTYTVNDGEASIGGGIDTPAINTSTTGVISIPSILGGCPVVAIESYAFSGCCGLTSVSMPDGIVSVGDFSFFECGGLNEIVVPNSVTNIGSGCFAGCTNLVSMALPFVGAQRGNNGNAQAVFGHLFGDKQSDGLTNVVQAYTYESNAITISRYIPIGLKHVHITDESLVAKGAFDNCSTIENIVLNDGVDSIEEYAFAHCASIERFDVPTSITSIGKSAFLDCRRLSMIELPTSLQIVGQATFSGCSSLTNMVLPFVGSQRGNSDLDGRFGFIFGFTALEGLTAVGSRYIPSSLKRVVITDETVVSRSAFDQCVMLTEIELNEGVRDIGQWAFAWCNITNMIIPNSVTNIGMGVFACCGKLESLTLPFVGSERGNNGTSDSLFGYALGNSSYDGGVAIKQYYSSSSYLTYYVPATLRSVTITDETILGYGAFYGCSGLKRAAILNGVTSICAYAFYGCSGLAEVMMPESVVSIGYKAFAGCPIEDGINYKSAEIRNVTAKQRFPWNGKVDITYEVVGNLAEGLPDWNYPVLVVSATNRVAGTTCTATVDALLGDIGTEERVHHVIWDLNVQGIEFKSDDVVFSVVYRTRNYVYCVIDLSAGSSASSYPVTYMDVPPSGGFNVSEYKATKLVLKCIEAGSFKMGGSYNVTLTKPFYCGLFEVTQRQWELVMGSNPCSSTSCGKGNSYPVHYVSYNMIRGSSAGAGLIVIKVKFRG